ncbi:MAG: PLDc N-terminal domain-containing protein [Verrucomicrobiota bacterium]
MRTVLENILRFAPQNTSDLVLQVAMSIWVVLWIVCLADVKASHRGTFGKIFWMLVLTVPLAGLLLYAFSQFVFADWRTALAWRKNDATKKPGGSLQAS